MKFAELKDSVQDIISDIMYLTIASMCDDGTPWISPVYFNFDSDCNFYWISYKDAIHSKNVARTKKASISIYDSTLPVWEGDGVYAQCDVMELENHDDIKNAISVYYGGRHIEHGMDRKNVSDYVNDKPWRIYKAIPFDITTLSEGYELDGYHVDQRIPAESESHE
jgi:uncharacterized protein YhbP (UPF0306 family)